MLTRSYALAAALLLAAFLALGLSSARRKSLTFDETVHLPAAWAIWHLDDYRFNPTNGNLPKRIAGLPLLHTPTPPDLLRDASFPRGHQWEFGRALLDGWGPDRLTYVLHARCAMLAFAALGGLLVFALSARLWGPTGGVLSLALYTLSPTVLAHARLVTSDLTVSLTFLAATTAYWSALRAVSLPRVLAFAALTGLAAISKMSAPILALVFLALTALRLAQRRPLLVCLPGQILRARHPAAIPLAALALALAAALGVASVTWLAFGLRYPMANPQLPPLDPHAAAAWADLWTQPAGPLRAVAPLHTHHLLPEAYLHGLAYVLDSTQQRSAFLAGHHSMRGWTAFFPLAILWKTPLATLSLLALGLALTARHLLRRPPRWTRPLLRTAPLWVFTLVYLAVALRSQINIGHRHVLPLYPPVFVLLGALASTRRTPWLRRLALAALLPLALETASVHPHYLAFFNQAAGGPQRGHELLVDSSLDWGQDLPALADFAATTEGPLFFAYFGSADPAWYDVDGTPISTNTPTPLTPGTYAISATYLSMVRFTRGPWSAQHEFEYRRLRAQATLEPSQRRRYAKLRLTRLCAVLRRRPPRALLAHTWLVFDVDDETLHTALNAPLPFLQLPPLPPELRLPAETRNTRGG